MVSYMDMDLNNRQLAIHRYARVLYALLTWKYLTPEHIARMLSIPLPNAYRYIRRLRDLGLVRSDRILGYTLVSLTREGREYTYDLLPEVDMFRSIYPAYTFKGEAPHNLMHELKVRELHTTSPSVSFSVYAKVIAKVFGKDTIGFHRADAVRLKEIDGHIYPVAVEVELTPKSRAKMKRKLTQIAESIGEIYSGVVFVFRKKNWQVVHRRYIWALENIPSGYAQKIASYSNLLEPRINYRAIEIYRDIENELKHLHKYILFSDIEIDWNASKRLSRKLR
jgi:DNA-binding MarR family transcriptional regulator